MPRRPITVLGALCFLGALSALCFSGASSARAHIGHTITRAERYLKLDAAEDETRFVVSLTLGPDEGRNVLTEADRDHDGQVTSAEGDAYLAQWATGLATEVPIEIDGEPVTVTWTDGFLDPIGAVRATPLTVEMVAHLPVEGREHTIVVHDRMVRREVFDRTDVAFRAHDGAELLLAGPTASPPDVIEDAAFMRGGGLDVMTARVRYPNRSAVEITWVVGAGAVSVLLAIAVAMRARRKR